MSLKSTKAVWNFSLSDGTVSGATLLKTETRVLCLDEASRRRFRLYWSVVGFFSGIIRREILRVIKNSAEREQRAAAVSVREA